MTLSETGEKAFIGGIGTGCLAIEHDGRSSWQGITKTSRKKVLPAEYDALLFAVTARSENADAAVLPLLPCASRSIGVSFAAASTAVRNDNLRASLYVCNPFLPLNSVDSGIPAAFAALSVANLTDEPLTLSASALLNGFSPASPVTVGYDKKAACFSAVLGDAKKSATRASGAFALATDADDFTYGSGDNLDETAFCAHLSQTHGIFGGTGTSAHAIAVSAHFTLPPKESKVVRFIAAWHFPFAVGGEKSYYYHYFPDVSSVVTYGFRHFDRLLTETDALAVQLRESALDPTLLPLIETHFSRLRHPHLFRSGMGLTLPPKDAKYGYSPSFERLFPGLVTERASVEGANLLNAENADKSGSPYDTDLTDEEIHRRLRLIMALYLQLRHTGDVRFMAENWVDLAAMTQILCGSAQNGALLPREEAFRKKRVLQFGASYAMSRVAMLLRDKKRAGAFRASAASFRADLLLLAALSPDRAAPRLLSDESLLRFFLGAPEDGGEPFFFPRDVLLDAARRVDPTHVRADLFAACTLERLHEKQKAAEVVRNVLTNRADSYDALAPLMLLYAAASGFDYDKKSLTVWADFDDALADAEGSLRAFFCTVGAVGVLSQGVDFIELTVLSGELKVRTVHVSHKPYKVLYGGRFIPCAVNGNTVTLPETGLTVKKDKKLTVLVDISQ